MGASPKTWIDDSPPECNASDLNGFNLEINNLIQSAGISLDYNNHDQTAQAVVRYAADGNYYIDSGSANAYVLSVQSPKKPPVAYTEGQIVRFIALNSNNGPSTLNLSSLGLKNIILENGDALSGGEIITNYQVMAYYNGTDFVLITDESGVGGVTARQFQNCSQIYSNDTGTTGVLVATPVPAYGPYQNGTRILVKAANTNGGTATLNISSLGAVEIKQIESGGLVSLDGGEIQAGGIYEFIYDGTYFQLMNPSQTDSGVPVGTILPRASANVSPGYLAYNGQLASRTVYARLYAEMGTIWGAGDGSTTFQVGPTNPRRTMVGAGGISSGELGNTVGSLGGSETEALTEANNGPHRHIPDGSDTGLEFIVNRTGVTAYAFSGPGTFEAANIARGETSISGSGTPHNNIQPSMVVLFQVKY